MLLRGTYTFDPRPEDHKYTLPFSSNDSLLFLEVLKKDSDWFQVVDIYGRIGYVPRLFVEPAEDYADYDRILSFLADAVVHSRHNGFPSASSLQRLRDELTPESARIRAERMKNIFLKPSQAKKLSNETSNARPSTSEHNLNRRLINASVSNRELRRSESESELDLSHRISRRTTTTSVPVKPESRHVHYNCESENEGVTSDTSVKTAIEGDEDSNGNPMHHEEFCRDCFPKSIPARASPSLQAIRSSLVNVVQETSGLNPELSENLLTEVFQCMKNSTNRVTVPVESLLEKLSLSAMSSPEQNKTVRDLEKVMSSFSKLSKTEIKAGRQNRGVRVSTSQHQQFIEKLEKLRKCLVDCDTVHATQLLQLGQHAFSQDFSNLYNLESPQSIKERMLDIFLIIFTIDKKGRAVLLSTTLPIYLARDLMAQNGNHRNERKLFIQLLNVLVSLLSCGEPMPDTHFEILGTGFVNFILEEIENIYAVSSENEYDKIVDDRFCSMINFILVYNLQFSHPSKENIVLKVLAGNGHRPRGFLNVLMELLRRAYDPVQENSQDDYSPSSTNNSVFKMFTDICLCQRTVIHFSKSDKKKLIEIISDGLLKHPAGSTRLGYIKVLKALLGNIPSELKLGDIRTALVSILLDLDPLAVKEQKLVRRMSKEFPILFIKSISKVKMTLSGENNTSNLHYKETDCDNDFCYLSS